MQSINNLYSSVYLTAMCINTRRQDGEPFAELSAEGPMPKPHFARIKSRFVLAISRIRKLSLRPGQDHLASRELRT